MEINKDKLRGGVGNGELAIRVAIP